MIEDSDPSDSAANWAVRICVAMVFVLTGSEKFLAGSAPYWIDIFDAIGFGQWFRYFTGFVEGAGGLLFLIPATTAAGAAMLACAMIGAMVTQAVVLHHPADSIFPGLYLTAVIAAYVKLQRARATSVRRNQT
jgi:putative oxidoreductase